MATKTTERAVDELAHKIYVALPIMKGLAERVAKWIVEHREEILNDRKKH